jgi:hypothetical protein
MTTIEIITAIIIHLIIPIVGLLLYILLIRKIKMEKINNPPNVDFFLIFATYGGLLLVMLTTIFWKWSGMASLGTFYLIIGGPIVMGIIAYRNYRNKGLSKYHMLAYKAGLFYFLITPLTFGIFMIFE